MQPPKPQPEILIPFRATREEIGAINHVIQVYVIDIVPTMERSEELTTTLIFLNDFLQRYPRFPTTLWITFFADFNETLAFGAAVMSYCRFMRWNMSYSKKEAKMKKLVIAFQKRYLDSMRLPCFSGNRQG
jgi:hypothetical protein